MSFSPIQRERIVEVRRAVAGDRGCIRLEPEHRRLLPANLYGRRGHRLEEILPHLIRITRPILHT